MKKIILAASICLTFSIASAETAEVEIGGMSCGSCIKKVTKNLCQKDIFETCEIEMGKATLKSKPGQTIDVEFVKKALDNEDSHYKMKNIVVKK